MIARYLRATAAAAGLVLAAGAPVLVTGGGFVAAQDNRSLAPYVPSPYDVVNRMLTLAEVTADDVVYDLGSGDGRIVITAAQRYGARIIVERESRGQTAAVTAAAKTLMAEKASASTSTRSGLPNRMPTPSGPACSTWWSSSRWTSWKRTSRKRPS